MHCFVQLIPGWGYLSRTSSSKTSEAVEVGQDGDFFGDTDEVVEDEDESCIPIDKNAVERVHFHESIVWHPTYMVPAYYFQAVDSSRLLLLSVVRILKPAGKVEVLFR
jgi:hypothetical protein